jgi:hypothetical protein
MTRARSQLLTSPLGLPITLEVTSTLWVTRAHQGYPGVHIGAQPGNVAHVLNLRLDVSDGYSTGAWGFGV